MIGAVVIAGVCSMGVNASEAPQNPCHLYGSSFIQPYNGNEGAQGGGITVWNNHYGYPAGTTTPCETTSNTSNRIETWIDGMQAALQCFSPTVVTGAGACMGVRSPAQEGQFSGEFFYSHGEPLNGVWFTHSRHFYVANSGQTYGYNDTYDDHNFGDPGGDDPICIPGSDGTCDTNTPIILPLTNAQAYKLTDTANGVVFDLNADGVAELTAWTARGSKLAFLAIDRNENGLIDNGSELFGDNTLPGVPNGFAALRQIMPLADDAQTGGGGYIDAGDPVYPKLLLWEDRNHNGVSEADELQPLSNLYTRIGLGYSTHERRDGHGNEFRYRGFAEFRTSPGQNRPADLAEQRLRQRTIYDVIFTKR